MALEVAFVCWIIVIVTFESFDVEYWSFQANNQIFLERYASQTSCSCLQVVFKS